MYYIAKLDEVVSREEMSSVVPAGESVEEFIAFGVMSGEIVEVA